MRRNTPPLLRKYSLIGVLVISWCLSAGAEAQTLVERVNGGVVKLITGPDATSVQIAQDLSNVVDDGVTRRVLPVVGRGAIQNLIDLKLLRGIDVGVVRSDAFEDARALVVKIILKSPEGIRLECRQPPRGTWKAGFYLSDSIH